MGMIAEVLSVERTADGLDIKCDPGGGANITASHFGPPGEDSAPLPGDFVALEESSGSGSGQVSGYSDPLPSQAADGEKRFYARNAAGVPTAEIWLKGDGSITITPLIPLALVTVAGGAEFVALADKVLTELTAIKTAFDAHTHVYSPGPSAPAQTAPPTAPMTAPSSVASEVLKSD